MEFFGLIREKALRNDENLLLDLRKCQAITAEIPPLLMAEMQRVRYLRGKKSINGISPVNPRARRMLHALGFFNSMNIADPASILADDDMSELFSIETGTALDGQVTLKIAQDFAKALELSEEAQGRVQRALNEALENISEHGYMAEVENDYPAERGRWWICAVTLPDRNQAYLLAFDLGVTIQRTVEPTAKKRGPQNVEELMKFLAQRIGVSAERRLLEAAFEDGVTRRPDGKGGRGLGKMAQLVQEFDGGSLAVWSGGATAALEYGSSKITTDDLDMPFKGTFVLWSLSKAERG